VVNGALATVTELGVVSDMFRAFGDAFGLEGGALGTVGDVVPGVLVLSPCGN
jgi:hypothetical protein